MRVRSLRTLRRAWVLLALSAAAMPLSSVPAAPPARPEIHAGAELERRLAGGESQSFPLEAPTGARLLITKPDSRDALVILLPARMLHAGSYRLEIEGTRSDGKALAVAAYPFQVLKRP